METSNELIQKQKRKEWCDNNKDKLALYARNNYHKNIASNPEYLKTLTERVRRNRAKRQLANIDMPSILIIEN